ncbi:hypothetical protein UCDDA912_g00339 [Diaporthe ampelina]|uniref:Uncharacterized protein n=1 Tax=Diaporthe ampelina TaxID=1214573 RepID=A0A0G2IGF1_9PEZI|nr:hypothetical protein UCDDA912_g00339 [Diaporthe ampelina]
MTTTTSDLGYVPGYHGAGPLTTVFTTPDFCASLYWTDTATPPLSSLVCMPPKFHVLYDYSFGFYSPGICPTGYSKGCDFPNAIARTDDGGMVYYGGDVLEGETVRVCCPNGYTCLLNDQLAFALQVRWQESDLSILATDPTAPGSTYSAPSTATATPSAVQSTAASGSNIDSPTPSSSSSNTAAQNEDPASTTEGGIRVGTIIGIVSGVGGMAVAIAMSAIVFCIWRYRRKRREEKGTRVESMMSGVGDVKPSPASGGGFAPDNKAELDSRAGVALSEAPADRGAIEMPPLHIAATEMEVPHFVAELPGSVPAGHGGGESGGGQTPETGVPRRAGAHGPLEKAVCGEGPVSIKADLAVVHINGVDNDTSDDDRG